jgi:hypothetical protein
MTAEAKLEKLLDSQGPRQYPLLELLIDVICMIDAEWDISQAPSLEAIRAILAALVIDCGAASDGDEEEEQEEEFREFDRRFVDAFKTFQSRMQSAGRRLCE